MKLTMDVNIVASGKHLGIARKEFETNLLPYEGLEIEDTAWKDPITILSVVISYQSEYIYVALEENNIIKEDKYETIKKMFIGHGWQIL